jgi:acetyl-CoA carboxylase carboxyl transferase subunit alpha
MTVQYLDFERPVGALEKSAEKLRREGQEAEARALSERAERQLRDIYGRLSPWQRTQVARHPGRPRFFRLAEGLFTDMVAIAGDRSYGEDRAIWAGFARLSGRPVALIGHVKGEDTESRIAHNFGMARPEGYRKAVRLFEMANRFGLPVISLVDTAGAFPGVDAEERGQAEAIAAATEACLAIGVPFLAAIVGEGGSGGAVAVAAANRVLMLENAIYSVISPEGCASILWRSGEAGPKAADAMKLTAGDLLRLNVIDRIVYEPLGGAHRDPETAIARLAAALGEELALLDGLSASELRADRRARYLKMAA